MRVKKESNVNVILDLFQCTDVLEIFGGDLFQFRCDIEQINNSCAFLLCHPIKTFELMSLTISDFQVPDNDKNN